MIGIDRLWNCNWMSPVLSVILSSGLFAISGCSSTTHANHQDSGDRMQMNHEGDAGSDSPMQQGNHEAKPYHQSSENSEGLATTTQAKLTVPADIAPDRSIPLEILITDAEGKSVSQFDIFQEKLLHAIAVSNDLQSYDHIHPDYQENGKFKTNITFPKPGDYTIFLDYKPAGEAERVSLVAVSVPGTPEAAPQPDFAREKTIDTTKVELNLDTQVLKANEDVMVQFTLKDASGNPVELQPYLGERGHLVIVQKGDRLTDSSYLHSHAMKESPTGQVQFHTQFPETGQYKMWGQFNRNGQILTADFWVNVEQ